MIITQSLVVGDASFPTTPASTAEEAFGLIRDQQQAVSVPSVEVAYGVLRLLGVNHTAALERIVFGATGALLRG